MHAIQIDPKTNDLTWDTVPDPFCGPDDVVLEIAACGVNRADLLQRRGLYPPPPGASNILGLEAAGVVGQVGSNVQGWLAGDRAMCLLAGGGYAERVRVHASAVGLRVVEIGRSVLFPRDDVMELAVVHTHRAVRVGTRCMDRASTSP